MKIGIFDSGLGGLIMTKALIQALPQYDHVYLGDTANLPYGARSAEQVCALTTRCVNWLFREQDCALVLIACNTATIAAIKHLQTEYLPANFPSRFILGIVSPTVEAVAAGGFARVGLVATEGTVRSGVYEQELRKLSPGTSIKSLATPLLVPLVENGGDKYAPAVIADYVAPLADVEALVLGCTHYPHYKEIFARQLPNAKIISQDEIIPAVLSDYLAQHKDLEATLSRGGSRFFGVTDITGSYASQAERIFGGKIDINQVAIPA